MVDQPFSFRWGIHLLDKGDTRIPNFFFDRYHQAGITRTQFLTILHLARYQYETPGSQCRPSVPTVAKQMGYTPRGLQKVLATMESQGLLQRHYRASRPTIYDFTGFSSAILEAELRARNKPRDVIDKQLQLLLNLDGEPQFTPDGEPQFTPMVNPSSPKEEKKEEQTRNDDGGANTNSVKALTNFGVDSPVAHKLAAERDTAHILAWIEYANSAKGLRDPVGFVVRRLLDNEPAPTPRKKKPQNGLAFTAICTACSRVMYADRLCETCRLCPECCECKQEGQEP